MINTMSEASNKPIDITYDYNLDDLEMTEILKNN